jgi:L-histidine N-alpha-methyltransferase
VLTEAIERMGTGWSLCFIGEDQASKLGLLANDLKKGFSETGDGKQVASGFSYWGIGPTIAWLAACQDPLYPVMNQSISNFSHLWNETASTLDEGSCSYVSLGVGTGHKDNLILQHLLHSNPQMHYIPVDMSPEMLRIGSREAIRATKIERGRVLPVQIDFSFDENAVELRNLLDGIVGNEPILFSLLGNTLSNFDFDSDLLRTMRQMLRPQDRLLLEVAFTDSLTEEAQQRAAEEYNRSRMFKEFVTSSLLQNTDLRVGIDHVSFSSSAEEDRAILIKALYRNSTGNLLTFTLPDRTTVSFPEKDTIRLLTMRKYAESGLEKLLGDCRMLCLKKARRNFPGNRAVKFGTELALLRSDEAQVQHPYQWDIFLAHAGPDADTARTLYDLLSPHCRVFLDSQSLVLGDNWDLELTAAQRRALVTVILISSHTGHAYYAREEIAAAIHMARTDERKHRVVPVFLDGPDASEVPYGLRLKHGVHLSPQVDLAAAAKRLVELIRKLT